MNYTSDEKNTQAFSFMATASFGIASIGMLIGIFYLPVEIWVKGYLGMGYLFTVTSCFTLAKTLRDKHEEKRIINRIQDAKTEKLLTDYEKVVN